MQLPEESIPSAAIHKANPEIKAKNMNGFFIKIPVTMEMPDFGGTSRDLIIEEHIFFVNTDELLGKGAFGSVYQTYLINPDTLKINFEKPYATKILLKSKQQTLEKLKHDAKKEFGFFTQFYRAFQPHIRGDRVYFVTEFFPGENLFDKDYKLSPPFLNLDFGTTLQLIQNICLAINLLHHETPSTGGALTHNDLTGRNIKVEILEAASGRKKINVYPLDFGLSKEIEHDPTATIKGKTWSGTIHFLSPERFRKTRGIKSDVYSLVPIILALLGVDNPFVLKEQYTEDEDFVDAKYDLTNLLVRFKKDLETIPYSLNGLIVQFLNNMQRNEYQFRPDSDEVLKFFTALNVAYQLAQEKLLKEGEYNSANDINRQQIGQELTQLGADLKTQYCTMILLARMSWRPAYVRIINNLVFQNKIIKELAQRTLTAQKLQALAAEANASEEKAYKVRTELKEFKGKYPTAFIEQIYEYAEVEPYVSEIFLIQLRNLSSQQKLILTTLLNFNSTYNAKLGMNSFIDAISSKPSDLVNLIAQCTVAFIEKKSAEASEKQGGARLLSFLRYNNTEILESSEKLLSIARGINNCLTPKDESVLKSTPLGEVLNVLNGFEAIAAISAPRSEKKY